jgi:hypothetical protein
VRVLGRGEVTERYGVQVGGASDDLSFRGRVRIS